MKAEAFIIPATFEAFAAEAWGFYAKGLPLPCVEEPGLKCLPLREPMEDEEGNVIEGQPDCVACHARRVKGEKI